MADIKAALVFGATWNFMSQRSGQESKTPEMGRSQVGAVTASDDSNGREITKGKGRTSRCFTNGVPGTDREATQFADRVGGILSQLIHETED